MALYTDWNQIDREQDGEILLKGSIAKYYSQELFDETITWFQHKGYLVFQMDCEDWKDEVDMHKSISKVMDFPDYYGNNLNALNDCIFNFFLDGTSNNILLSFKKFNKFAEKNYQCACIMLDIFAEKSRMMLLLGRKLITILQSDDPTLRFEKVGGIAVQWNQKEWLNKNRGL